jgi:hypothetical protein
MSAYNSILNSYYLLQRPSYHLLATINNENYRASLTLLLGLNTYPISVGPVPNNAWFQYLTAATLTAFY